MTDTDSSGSFTSTDSTDSFTETTTTSWFSRILASIKGVLFGLLLLIVACVLLFPQGLWGIITSLVPGRLRRRAGVVR